MNNLNIDVVMAKVSCIAIDGNIDVDTPSDYFYLDDFENTMLKKLKYYGNKVSSFILTDYTNSSFGGYILYLEMDSGTKIKIYFSLFLATTVSDEAGEFVAKTMGIKYEGRS